MRYLVVYMGECGGGGPSSPPEADELQFERFATMAEAKQFARCASYNWEALIFDTDFQVCPN